MKVCNVSGQNSECGGGGGGFHHVKSLSLLLGGVGFRDKATAYIMRKGWGH